MVLWAWREAIPTDQSNVNPSRPHTDVPSVTNYRKTAENTSMNVRMLWNSQNTYWAANRAQRSTV